MKEKDIGRFILPWSARLKPANASSEISSYRCHSKKSEKYLSIFPDYMQNNTIEERVALLEIQVTDLEQNVSDLDQDVNFLFDEQVLQDERLFQLETETEGIEEEVEG